MSGSELQTELLVCVKCRAGTDVPENGVRPGAALYERLNAAGVPDGVTIKPVECLSNCSQGCSIVVRGGSNRWTYIYGNLRPDDHVDVVQDGVGKYHATADGVVPWRERPEHFRKNCIARIPPLEV